MANTTPRSDARAQYLALVGVSSPAADVDDGHDVPDASPARAPTTVARPAASASSTAPATDSDDPESAASSDDYLSAEADRGDPEPLTDEALEAFIQRLEESPSALASEADSFFDGSVTRPEVIAAARRLQGALRSPETATTALKARRVHAARTGAVIPPEFDFEGYDPTNIPLCVDETKFETRADWDGYAGSWIAAKARLRKKAAFPWHSQKRSFVYSYEPPPARPFELALFSDFGTGYAHSRYIAKQFAPRDGAAPFDALVHLGDIYYVGTSKEFVAHMIDPLRDSLPTTPLFTMNANHEMYSGGHAYYDFMRQRRRLHPGVHVQEGSYFALRIGARHLVVALDTDYFGHGRHQNESLRRWALWAVRAGKAEQRRVTLLTANQPYAYSSRGTTSLYEDMAPLLPHVDLWFWGNTHYAGLFEPRDNLPHGSCIGHGGYPYHRSEYDLDEPESEVDSYAKPIWIERGGRYPAYTGLRPELGSNGFCALSLRETGQAKLVYRDWMGVERCIVEFEPQGVRGFELTRLEA